MVLSGPQFPHLDDHWPASYLELPGLGAQATLLLLGSLSCALALSPGHSPQGGTPGLSTGLSGRITPFCLLTAAQGYRGLFLLPSPADNTPGQEGPLLPAQPSPTPIHTPSLSALCTRHLLPFWNL